MNHPLIVKVRYGFVALTAAWFLSALVALSDAGLDLLAFVIYFYAAVALSAGWVFCLITSRRGSHRRSALLSLIALPAATLLVYLLSALDPPQNPLFRLRFLASRSTLAATAEAALVAPPADLEHVALFGIDHVEVYDGQVRFITTNCGFIDQCGIVYSPTQLPTRIGKTRFASLGGPWYQVHQIF
jgi:hypothetical protein